MNPVAPVDTELVWLYTYLDLTLAIRGFRRHGYAQYAVSLREWLTSIQGKKVDAVFQLKDPLPGMWDLGVFLKTFLTACIAVT